MHFFPSSAPALKAGAVDLVIQLAEESEWPCSGDPKEISSKAANVGVAPEQGATLAEMVTEDLMLERQQIEVYTALIRELGDQDLVTRQVLLSILVETEKHASELADYLKRSPNQ